MKILAIWDRHKIAPKSRLILVLTDDNKLLEITPGVRYLGRDKDNECLYEDTGNYDIWNVFDEDSKFDFKKANYFALHFGFILIKQFKRDGNELY